MPHSLIFWTHVDEDAVQTWCYAAPTQGKQTTCYAAGCNKQAGHSGASPATHALTHQKPLCRESGVFDVCPQAGPHKSGQLDVLLGGCPSQSQGSGLVSTPRNHRSATTMGARGSLFIMTTLAWPPQQGMCMSLMENNSEVIKWKCVLF